jgi:L-malate glycosyltransferase
MYSRKNQLMTASSSISYNSVQSKTLKIAMVAPSLDILGGQGVQACDLTEALKSEGFDVLFVPVNPKFPYGLRWVRKIPFVRTLLNQIFYFFTLGRLRHADVVHIFSASYWSFLLAPVPAIAAARLFGKRIILNYHSGEADDHLSHWGRRVHPWLRLVDQIVVPSEYLKRVFAEHGYPTQVIRNIVDTSAFRFRTRTPLHPHLVSTRNLESLYGVDNTLRAFAIVQKTLPEATLTVGGFGSEAPRLKQLSTSLGLRNVRFIGRVEPRKMPAVYDSADIFLNSSTIDNQPISILEAFAAGLPVVSTPTGDIPSMVRDGISGRIVPHNDPQAMADAVLQLLREPQSALRMIEMAREEVEKFTWPQVCEQWSAVYNRNPT